MMRMPFDASPPRPRCSPDAYVDLKLCADQRSLDDEGGGPAAARRRMGDPPARHHAEALHAYINAAGIANDRKGCLFRTSRGHNCSLLSDKPLSQPDAWR